MFVYRLSEEKYAKKLNASGARNRWNKKGQFVLYTGSSRAISTLEQLVHLSGVFPVKDYKMMVIDIKNNPHSIKEINLLDLGKNWRKFSEYPGLQAIGSEWYEEKKYLLLKIPSAVIPQESNYIINTSHPEFKKLVKIKSLEDFFWDRRLF